MIKKFNWPFEHIYVIITFLFLSSLFQKIINRNNYSKVVVANGNQVELLNCIAWFNKAITNIKYVVRLRCGPVNVGINRLTIRIQTNSEVKAH